MNKKNVIVFSSLIIVIVILSIIYFPKLKNERAKRNDKTDKGEVNMNINVIIENKIFTATLEDNETSRKFIDMLPLEINMSVLNKNEKYYYLDQKLPISPYNPKKINNGDIMIYGNDCLVLFYKSFNTSYSYTKIGSIDNPKGLDEALGNGNVKVKFESR